MSATVLEALAEADSGELPLPDRIAEAVNR